MYLGHYHISKPYLKYLSYWQHTYAVSQILKGTAKSKVMLQLMHSMRKSYSKTVVYFIHTPSVLRKKAN